MTNLLGVDLGTSGTKTVLFDAEGREVSSQSVEYPLYQPQNGWAEQDPRDWWNAAVSTIRGVLEKSGVNPGDVKGLGISGQMHGLVLLDESGEPLGRSLLWCDGRTQRECDEITQAVGEKRLIEISAYPALTGFTAGKILWVRRHQPELFARARHALLPKDYVRYRLTGVLAQEISDASGTNLLDVPARRWSAEIMDKLGLDMALLPPLVESCEAAGAVTPEAAALTGLRAGTVVAGGAGDNMAAAIGTGVAESGRAFTTIGTSGVVFAHSDTVRIDPEGRVHTFCAAVPGAYTNMSCTLAAGLSLKWYRELFADEEALTSLRNSVVLAVSAALIATVIGTFGALGLNTMRKRWLRGAVQTVTNIPMMNPDIVTGVSMMLLFVAAATILGTSNTFGFGTLLIAHVTFDLPYVILSVMPRFKTLDSSLSEAAQDLGCTTSRAFFAVELPELVPGIM